MKGGAFVVGIETKLLFTIVQTCGIKGVAMHVNEVALANKKNIF